MHKIVIADQPGTDLFINISYFYQKLIKYMSIIYESTGIMIKEFMPSEEHLFCALFEDDEVTRFLPQLSLEEYKKHFVNALEDYRNGPFGRWGVFDSKTNDCIGNCLFRPRAESPDKMEIGYSLRPQYWGKGIGTEIAKALVAYGFQNTLSKEITALTNLENIASQKVLKKAGFEQLKNIHRAEMELNCFRIKRVSYL